MPQIKLFISRFQTDYDSVMEQLAEQKRVCGELQRGIFELEAAAAANENVNTTNLVRTTEMRAMESEINGLKAKLEEMEKKSSTARADEENASHNPDSQLAQDFTLLQKKYDMTRRLCNLRNDDISKLRQEISELEENFQLQKQAYLKLSEKYATVKGVCGIRLDKLKALRARLGEANED